MGKKKKMPMRKIEDIVNTVISQKKRKKKVNKRKKKKRIPKQRDLMMSTTILTEGWKNLRFTSTSPLKND